ncbi:hypothetical protein D3C81_1899510 [compost metagenome]
MGSWVVGYCELLFEIHFQYQTSISSYRSAQYISNGGFIKYIARFLWSLVI